MKHTKAVLVAVLLPTSACDGGDSLIDGGSNQDLRGLDVVTPDDPWLAQLDHAGVSESGPGYVVAGYDAKNNEIGRISVYPIGPELLRVTHEYPRPCADSGPIADCIDVVAVTMSFAGPPDEHWTDVDQTLPGDIASQRMHALLIKAGESPQPIIADHLKCALTVAGSAAACFSAVVPVAGAAVCGAGTLAAVCACKAQFEKIFPDLDIDKVCDPQL